MSDRPRDPRLDLSCARHDASELADALTKAWAIRQHAPGAKDAYGEQIASARAALERINAVARRLGIDPVVLPFRGRPAPVSEVRPAMTFLEAVRPEGFVR